MATMRQPEFLPPTSESEPEKSGFFYDLDGKEYEVNMVSDHKEGSLVEIKDGDEIKRMTIQEWRAFKQERGALHEDEILNTEEEKVDFDIMEVKAGDILEMSDGSYLKIISNDIENKKVTFEHIEPGGQTDKKGKVKSRGYDLWRTYQDEVKEYLPAKMLVEKSKTEEESPVIEDKIEEKIEDKPVRRPDYLIPKDNAPEYEWATGKGKKRPKDATTRREGLRDNPAEAVKRQQEQEDQKRYDEIMKDLSQLEQSVVPLDLKPGQDIWNEQGEKIKVIDVVINPNTNSRALKDGYVVLGFNPKEGRNKVYKEEVVPFAKLDKQRDKIYLTEQIPYIELDKEEEEEKPPFQSKFIDRAVKKKWWQFWK